MKIYIKLFISSIALLLSISNIYANEKIDNNITLKLVKEIILDSNLTHACDMQYSSDEKSISVAYGDYYIRILDIENGKLSTVIHDDESQGDDGICSIAFSPDGKKIISGSLDNINIWDKKNSTLLKKIPVFETSKINTIKSCETRCDEKLIPVDFISNLNYSPDGKNIIAYAANTVMIWDDASGKVIKKFMGNNYLYINSYYATYSPNGSEIAIQLNNKSFNVGIFDSKDYKLKYKIGIPSESISCMKFSPNGKQIAISYNNDTIKIFDIKSGVLLYNLIGKNKKYIHIKNMSYAFNGKVLLSVSNNSNILKIWDIKNGKLLNSFKIDKKNIDQMIYLPNKRYIVTTMENRIKVWKIEIK